MRSSISVFYLAVSAALCASTLLPAQSDPDALYRDRETLASVVSATEIWRGRLSRDPRDFESAWKLARAQYWLGTQGVAERERKATLEQGIMAARQAVTLAPQRPDGHFWLAANMGALAESFGNRQGIRYRGAIRDSLETVLKLDAAYLDGSADRALGRWYFKVPGLFGGSRKRSEEHLRKALAYNPQSVVTRLFLAETLLADNRPVDARREIEAALAAPDSIDWGPEDRAFKKQASELLAKMKR